MKVFLSFLLCGPLCFASVCDKINGSTVGDVEENFEKVGESRPILPEALFNKYMEGFKYNECMLSIRQKVFNISNELVFFYYTNEDRCDGGNSFGSVVDRKGEIVAEITDSFIDC